MESSRVQRYRLEGREQALEFLFGQVDEIGICSFNKRDITDHRQFIQGC
jgi:hypothetical protein